MSAALTRRTAFAVPAAVMTMGAVKAAPASVSSSDGALLAMVEELEAIEASGEQSPRWRRLFLMISVTQAHTPEGLRAKGRIASLVVELDSSGRPYDDHQLVLWSLTQDIARIT